MSNQRDDTRRDEVLFAFHRECERPSADEIIRWTTRYPEFAEDIREHAAILLDWDAMNAHEALEPSEELLARGRSRALNAVHNAQTSAAGQGEGSAAASFDALLAARGTTVPALARHIEIERSVLADLVTGRVRPPIGGRLQAALADGLQATIAMVQEAVTYACAHPRLGQAKASKAPAIVTRSYEETIRGAGMTPERQAYWLDED
jgi:hypothetical protein